MNNLSERNTAILRAPFLRSHDLIAASRLFSELLDSNHDAWKIERPRERWFFYREVGGTNSHFPPGSVVISERTGSVATCDFYHSRGRHSLLETFQQEVPQAIDILLSRERCIALFNGLAHTSPKKLFDHSLGFCGEKVTNRIVRLRTDTSVYEHLVGNTHTDLYPSSTSGAHFHGLKRSSNALSAGIMVSQHGDDIPKIECSLNYPRPISLQFSSARLWTGVHAVTDSLALLVTEHNREVEQRFY